MLFVIVVCVVAVVGVNLFVAEIVTVVAADFNAAVVDDGAVLSVSVTAGVNVIKLFSFVADDEAK